MPGIKKGTTLLCAALLMLILLLLSGCAAHTDISIDKETRDHAAESVAPPLTDTDSESTALSETFDTGDESAEPSKTSETQDIPCKHIPVVDEGKQPTCTEAGLTEGSHCEICGEVLASQEVIPPLGHTAVTVKGKKATCTEEGLTDGSRCSVCGAVLAVQEKIPASGHKPVTDKAVAATCTKSGKTEGSHCSVCQVVLVKQKAVAKTGHKAVKDAARAPTCTEKGLTEGSHCSVCGKIITEQKTVEPLGHHYVDGVCTRCGATYVPTQQIAPSYMLHETADAGHAYQDSIIFLGDSTTAHLINRGGLLGEEKTQQVWRGAVGNTITFAYIETVKIIYPPTGEKISIAEAAKRAQPKYLFITLGVTGAVSNNLKEASFKKLYKWLIDSILEVSPDTVIIVQSIYPVKRGIRDHYPTVTNEKIIRYNGYIEEVVKEEYDAGKNVYYLYTYDALLDGNGNLCDEYGMGDCLHITAAGYEYILNLIRTHAVTLQ